MHRLIINGRFLDAGAGSADAGAVNRVALDLSRAMAQAPAPGWQVELAVPPSLAAAARAFLPDLPSDRLHLPHLPGAHLRGMGALSRGAAWDQLAFARLARRGILAGFFNTVPLVGRGHVTLVHDAQVFTCPSSYGGAVRAWRQALSRRAGAAGNHVLTVSQASRDALLGQGIGTPARIGVVPNGLGAVGDVLPDPGILTRLGLREAETGSGPAGARRYVLALSTLMAHKNIGVLLRAFAEPRLSDAGQSDPGLPDLALVLVGRAQAQDFRDAGHAVPVQAVFPGFVTDAELAALYRGALAVCVPSRDEGFGLPALEAMAHGSVAVVAPCGALPEVVGPAGLLADPDDPSAWAAHLAALRDDPALRADLARRGQARAAGFTWARAAQTAWAHLTRWYPQGARQP